MKKLRIYLASLSALLLAAGYLASQKARLDDTWEQYYKQVDQPPIVWLTLLLLLSAIVLCFVPGREEDQET